MAKAKPNSMVTACEANMEWRLVVSDWIMREEYEFTPRPPSSILVKLNLAFCFYKV